AARSRSGAWRTCSATRWSASPRSGPRPRARRACARSWRSASPTGSLEPAGSARRLAPPPAPGRRACAHARRRRRARRVVVAVQLRAPRLRARRRLHPPGHGAEPGRARRLRREAVRLHIVFVLPATGADGLSRLFIACPRLAARRRSSFAPALGVVALLPPALYALGSLPHAWYALPNPVTRKGALGESLAGWGRLALVPFLGGWA